MLKVNMNIFEIYYRHKSSLHSNNKYYFYANNAMNLLNLDFVPLFCKIENSSISMFTDGGQIHRISIVEATLHVQIVHQPNNNCHRCYGQFVVD